MTTVCYKYTYYMKNSMTGFTNYRLYKSLTINNCCDYKYLL